MCVPSCLSAVHPFAGGGITLTCTSFNCFSSTGLGDPHIKSPPLCVLGNSITSRIFVVAQDHDLLYPNLLSNSLCVPIHAHSIVSPSRSPRARYCSLTRTDQTFSYPCNFLNRSEGCSGFLRKN